ncbi:MAG TPA: Na(+)/H(+) antiporter subunit B [Opitutae bacterium]|mgnify:CR=1 FL=1|nr:Na(+)/H(+) antiporter subunit B [Opitutae bacterium]
MKYFILGHAGRILFPALIILSLIVLYRGHNLPGGGFIGGLMAATAYILVGLGSTMQAAKAKLRVDPVTLLAVGLAIAIISGLPGMLGGDPFLTGEWLPTFYLPLLGAVHLGTPLIFDVGVYLVVIGFTLHTTFFLSELAESDTEEGTD